jgi:hypothetical protein
MCADQDSAPSVSGTFLAAFRKFLAAKALEAEQMTAGMPVTSDTWAGARTAQIPPPPGAVVPDQKGA